MSITIKEIPKLAKDQETGVVGKFYVKRQGADVVVIAAQSGRHVSTIPLGMYERDGARMLDAMNKGEQYKALQNFAGAELTPEEAKEAKIDELENGADATREIPAWDRYLAACEAREGASLNEGLDRVQAEQWPAFVREVFGSLYGRPQSVVEPAESTAWISKLLEMAEGSQEWGRLQERSQGDPWAAGVGAGMVAAQLAEAARELLEKLPEQDPQRLAEDAKATEELLGPKHELTKEAQRAAQQAAQQAAAVLGELGQKEPAKLMEQVLKTAAATAQATIGEVQRGMGEMAGLGSGALRSVQATPDVIRRQLTANPKLRKIAELAGRLRIRARTKQRTKTKYSPESIIDVTIGGELERLLPTELGQLVTPETELLALRKLLERGALQYELEGTEELDRGPVILAVDSSGSMSGVRNEWAMAFAIAVLEIAAIQRRPFVLMHFDNTLQKTFRVEKPRNVTLQQLIEMVCYFSGGGTDFRPPLMHAHEIVSEGKRKDGTYARADVMLVTDGQASWGDWAAKLKSTGAALYGVEIESGFTAEMAAELTGLAKIRTHELASGQENVDLMFGI